MNANPRELHILSDAKSSRDRKSDVIMSSHSVIQQSIQTIYNIYSADLQSLWGTEHMDEMRMITDGWPYWPGGGNTGRAGSYSTMTGKDNGRLNSAYIWQFYSKNDESGVEKNANWSTYLDYDVHNNTPELKEEYHGMAWSCMTRNRDNDGDGKVDRDEVRWYLAAANQLIGMWVGNESLSMSARLYRPAERQWRAHILSSTDRRVCWAEEGGGATNYSLEVSDETWANFEEAAKGESVRCLRNIGTYYDESEGTVKDITGAPYKVLPQNYFTITPEPNENLVGVTDDPATHYVFSFDRLNPKSLREFTEGELPFNDQYSINNCVYLKMETQSRNDELLLMDSEGDYYPDYEYPYSKSLDKLNEEINKLGFNPYCPPGYRFQNQVENLLMSVYLPESFFIKDPSNVTYPGTVYMPTRTYFDRGLYGKNTEGFEYDRQGFNGAKNREQQKVGWTYNTNSKKNTSARTSYKMSRSRCVRDINMTGTIEGGLLLNDIVYPGDQVPVSFSFYSSGSTFISASLKFCYTDGSGVYHERDIPVQTTPSGLQYLATQNIKLPTVSEMGLEDIPLSQAKPKFKITLRNAYVSKTFEQPVALGNPISGDLELVGGDEAYPMDSKALSINLSSDANTIGMTSATWELHYEDHDGTWRSTSPQNLSTQPNGKVFSSTQSLTIPRLGDLTNMSSADLGRGSDKTFIRITVTDEAGSKNTVDLPIAYNNPITGTLSVAAGYVYPFDSNTIGFDISTNSTVCDLSSVSFSLSYTDIDGSTVREQTSGFSALTAPSGKTYSSSQTITFPALSHYPDLSKPVTLIVHITDTAGTEKDVTYSVDMHSHLYKTDLSIIESLDVSGFPVNTQIDVIDGFSIVSGSAILQWRTNGDSDWRDFALTTPSDQTINTISELLTPESITLSSGAFINYRVQAECNDGTIAYSPVWSMKFLEYQFTSPGTKWAFYVDNLNFEEGSYIQAKINTTGSTNRNELLAFGIGTTAEETFYPNSNNENAKSNATIHTYYRTDQGNKHLRIGGWPGNNYSSVDVFFEIPNLVLLLNQDGLSYNGTVFTNNGGLGQNVTNVKNSTFLMVGSAQGTGRSVAYYDFIRVIRKYEL